MLSKYIFPRSGSGLYVMFGTSIALCSEFHTIIVGVLLTALKYKWRCGVEAPSVLWYAYQESWNFFGWGQTQIRQNKFTPGLHKSRSPSLPGD